VKRKDTEQSPTRYPAALAWIGLAAVYLGFLTVGFVFHFLPPILPAVIADLGLSHGQAGLLMSLFALPGILLSLPGGWLVDRYGERLVGSLGVVLMGVGTLLLGLAPSFYLILLARVLSGVGAMVGVVALQRLVTRLFAGRSLGLPVGISGSALPVGIVVVLNAAGPLAESSGWRAVALRVGGVTALVGVVFALAVWFITRGQTLGREQKQDDTPLTGQAHLFRPIWIAGAVWFSANGAMTAFMTFAPDHFQGLGFDVSARGLFTSIPMWTSAALGMVTGWFTDRHGGRSAFMAVGMTMMGVALVALPAAVVSPSLIGLVLGLSLAAVVTPTITLPGVLLPPSHIGRGYGILATCANLGIFIVPPLAGVARDLSGGYVWPFVIMGLVAFGGVAAADRLRRGHFTPGLSRKVLLASVLLLITGCGNQDRYGVVTSDQEVAGTLALGHISDKTMFFDSPVEADAWSAADFVVAGGAGRIVRVQGDLATSLQFPSRDHVVGVLCQPGGEVLFGTVGGEFWRWSAGDWQQLDPIPGGWAGLVTRDHLNRPVALGEDSKLYRYEASAWQEIADDTWGSIRQVWAHPDQGTWLLTGDSNILQVTSAGVVREDSLATYSDTWDDRNNYSIAGDGGDHLVVSNGGPGLWIRDGGVWGFHVSAADIGVNRLFWWGGELYANIWSEVYAVWGAGGWEPMTLAGVSETLAETVAQPASLLLITHDAAGFVFDGTTATPVSHSLSSMRGLAEFEGRLLAFLRDGSLYQAESLAAGVWRHVGQTDRATSYSEDNALLVDDRGRVVVRTVEGLVEWSGTQFIAVSATQRIRRMQRLPDGEILVSSNDDDLGSLRAGQMSWWNADDLGIYSIRGARRRSPTVLEVIGLEGAYEVATGAEPRLLWTPVGWTPDKVRVLAPDRAVVLGRRIVRELIGDRVVDQTPNVLLGSNVSQFTLSDVYLLPDDRLLAWAEYLPGFLLRDASGWQVLQPLNDPGHWLMSQWGAGLFVATAEHGLLFYGDGFLARVNLSGGAS